MGNFGPMQLVLNGALLNPQPVNAVVIAGLDTNAHQLQILINGQIKLTRTIRFVESGNHKLVAHATRGGEMVLRYRGSFVQQAGYPVFLMDLENLPKKPAPQIVELPTPRPAASRAEAVKPSLKPFAEHAQSLPGEFERLSYLKIFLEEHNYTVADLFVLGNLLKFEHTRLQFFVAAYAGCEDPENFSKLAELLDFEVSKNTLAQLKNK